MSNPASPLLVGQSLFAKGLEMPNIMERVYDATLGYNVVSSFINDINGGKSVRTDNAKYQVGKMQNMGITALISSNALSGTDIVVTLTQPTDLFRLDDVVSDKNNVSGRVIAKTSTSITLSPLYGVTFSTATHFVAGGFASFMFNLSNNSASKGTEVLNYTPDLDYNVTSITRRSGFISRRDMAQSWVKWSGKYWYFAQEPLTRMEFAREIERKFLYSERGYNVATPTGTVNTTGGIRWSARNQGGLYVPVSSPLVQSSFDDIIYDFAQKSAAGTRKIKAFMGRAALDSLQNINATYIQYPGSENTFGATVGIDSTKYAKMGIQIDFVHCQAFDDPGFMPDVSSITGRMKKSSTILLVDMTPTPSLDGAGSIAPIQKYHFGEQEMIYKYIPGMIGANGMSSNALPSDYNLAANDVDGFSFEMLTDDGLYCVGEKMAWIELVL